MSEIDKLNFAKASNGWPPVWHALERLIARRIRKRILQFKGLKKRCASKHRKNHRETVGWQRKLARGVCSLLKWSWRTANS